jgi:hypothetical protein
MYLLLITCAFSKLSPIFYQQICIKVKLYQHKLHINKINILYFHLPLDFLSALYMCL